MATEFVVTVKQSGSSPAGDYTTLESACNANECDLTTAKVLSHSGITGTIADGSSVTGKTSGATGTAKHVSSNQILITPSSGTFQSGEQIYKDDGVNYVTSTTSPDSVQLSIKIDGSWSSADTSAVTIHNYTTDATRYINIYTTSAARHKGKWSTSYYILNPSSGSGITCAAQYTRITGLQIYIDNTGTYSSGIVYASGGYYTLVDKNIIRGTGTYGYAGISPGYGWNIRNNVVYKVKREGISSGGNSTVTIYNNTVYMPDGTGYWGIRGDGSGVYVKNNIVVGTFLGDPYLCYYGTTAGNCATNTSSDNSAPGSGSKTSVTPTFVDYANGDFHLASSDTVAKDSGTDLSAIFTDDIDGVTRSGTWDIGADEYVATSSSAIKTINGLAKASVKLFNGLAIGSVKAINGLN